MDVFTVSLFGHRKIENLWRLDKQISPVIKELLQEKSYVSFLIGRNGEFDEYVASIIKQIQKETRTENSEITLVLPYPVANIEYYEKYYDNIIVPEIVCNVHPKFAITLKNRWIVEQADLVVVNVEQRRGGAYAAMKYAERFNKKIINLFDLEHDLHDK